MGKAGRIVIIAGIAVVLLTAIISSTTIKPAADLGEVWDTDTIIGDAENMKHHYITYMDVMCPYCVAFEAAILENEEEFIADYIEGEKNGVFEVRVTDFLYEYGEHSPDNSRIGAEAIYCAKNQGKFWDYYKLVVKKLWSEYFSGGTVNGADEIEKDFWIDLAKKSGVDEEELGDCMDSHETLETIKENSLKAYQSMAETGNGGMPYFMFDGVAHSGFSLSWGWDEVKLYIENKV